VSEPRRSGAENEVDRPHHAERGPKVIQFQGLLHVVHRKGHKHDERDGLLHDLELTEREGRLDLGEDITVERNRLKAEPTLREFFDEQYMPYAKSAKKSWRDDQNRFKRIGEKFGDSMQSVLRY